MNLNDWVRTARKHRKWTQQQLGDAVGRSKANVALWEAGAHAPSYAQVLDIARQTGFPPPEMLPHDPNALNLDYSLSGRGGNVVDISVTGDIRFANGRYAIEPAAEGGFVLGSGVHDGYALRVCGDELHPAVRDGEFIILEEHGNPAFSEYCLLETDDGDRQFVEFLANKANGFAFENVQTNERLTISESDISTLHIVVAKVSRRQWRPNKSD